MAQQQLKQNINVVQIYPFNNPVSRINTKPVVLAGMPYVTFSKFYEQIMVVSSYTSTPYNDRVVNIKANHKKDYYKKIIALLKELPTIPKVIEVHQDTTLAVLIAKTFINQAKVALIRHGPALYRRLHEKLKLLRMVYGRFLLKHLTYVFGISEYVTNSLKKNYPKSSSKFITLYNSYGHLPLDLINDPSEKQNIITFVGKSVKFKGIFIFLAAIVKFLKVANNWQAMVIGAKFSNKSKYGKVIAKLNDAGRQKELNNILLYQNLSINEVFLKMQQSKIIVVPGIMAEPFCLVALEGHVAGAIMVTSGKGALKEVSGDYAYYLEPLNANTLLKTLKYIANNPKEVAEKAKLGQQRALLKFDPKILVEKLDNIRLNILNKA